MKTINELLEDIEFLVGESEDDNCEDSKYYLSEIIKDVNIIRELLNLRLEDRDGNSNRTIKGNKKIQ